MYSNRDDISVPMTGNETVYPNDFSRGKSAFFSGSSFPPTSPRRSNEEQIFYSDFNEQTKSLNRVPVENSFIDKVRYSVQQNPQTLQSPELIEKIKKPKKKNSVITICTLIFVAIIFILLIFFMSFLFTEISSVKTVLYEVQSGVLRFNPRAGPRATIAF
jgi:hypothetical protein